jgi:flagellar biosynthetic protein FlhB
MAEDPDDGQKTEEPSQRRLDEARSKGQVASSREVNHALMLGAGALLIGVLGPGVAGDVAAALRRLLEQAHQTRLSAAELESGLIALLAQLGGALLPAALLLVGAAIAGGLLQHGLIFSAAPLAPKFERLSPVAGVRRLFSLRSLIEFGKGVAKITLVGAAAVALLWPAGAKIARAAELDLGPLLGLVRDLALRLLAGAALLVGLIALPDLLYQRFEHRKRLRMSRRDLHDEFKQTEGDPTIKARLRNLRLERARRRMMAEVPKATVVVTNPTHIAIALRYDGAAMSAPTVVAKGLGGLAERIRAVARTHAVPVVRNAPLARALHAGVELGAEVPPAHYRAVAEVIGYVMRLRAGQHAPAR